MKTRKIAVTFLAILFLFGATPAYAAGPISEEPIRVSTDLSIVPFAEETEWVFRIHNSVVQKRLWSNTRGIWLTDWINC